MELRGGGARPSTALTVAFIDDHREVYGVEPICTALQFAPSTYLTPAEHENAWHAARQLDDTPSLSPTGLQ